MAATQTRSVQAPAAPLTRPVTYGRPHGRALITIVSVMILVGAEVFGVALAGGWGVAGLFDLGEVVGYVLMGVFSLGGFYLMVQLWHRAIAVESQRPH